MQNNRIVQGVVTAVRTDQSQGKWCPEAPLSNNFYEHSCKVQITSIFNYSPTDWIAEEKLFQSMGELIRDLSKDHVIIEA
jgi:hypothetical protein